MKEKLILRNEYIDKFKKYVNADFSLYENDDEIVFYNEVEIEYKVMLVDGEYQFKMFERGKLRQVKAFKNEKEMQLYVALFLKRAFGEKVEYRCIQRFRDIGKEELSELVTALEECISSRNYTINYPEKWKVNLQVKDNLFDIFIPLSTGKNKIIEENISKEYAYLRFYNEIVFLEKKTNDIKEYQRVFDVKLKDNTIDAYL